MLSKTIFNQPYFLTLKELRFCGRIVNNLKNILIQKYQIQNFKEIIKNLLDLNLIYKSLDSDKTGEQKVSLYVLTQKGRYLLESIYVLEDISSGKININEYLSLLKPQLKNSIFLSFENIWTIIKEKIKPGVILYSLKQSKSNEIIAISELGITVKTERGTALIYKIDIRKAWCNLVLDGVLIRDEHEKSTYRSSFMLMLFSQFDFVIVINKPRLSIKLSF